MVARILVLGGTGEARRLAGWVHARPGLDVVTSLAGRVSRPRLPAGEVRLGGFGGVPGLVAYLREGRYAAVVDATHPFAARISANAAEAAPAAGVPLLMLRRAGWTSGPGDRWVRVPDLPAAAAALDALGDRVFLTTGRQGLDAFAHLDRPWFLARCVDPPAPPLPPRITVVLDRGPYTVDGELALLRRHAVSVLVTKDSGGRLTSAKLAAARRLGLPVVVVDRPPAPDVPRVRTVAEAIAWLAQTAG